MGKIVRTISADASVVATAFDAKDVVSEIERMGDFMINISEALQKA